MLVVRSKGTGSFSALDGSIEIIGATTTQLDPLPASSGAGLNGPWFCKFVSTNLLLIPTVQLGVHGASSMDKDHSAQLPVVEDPAGRAQITRKIEQRRKLKIKIN